jgi:hypothetical protein
MEYPDPAELDAVADELAMSAQASAHMAAGTVREISTGQIPPERLVMAIAIVGRSEVVAHMMQMASCTLKHQAEAIRQWQSGSTSPQVGTKP